MMKTAPFYNDTGNPVWIGGLMVPPGATRMVDASLLPAEPSAPDTPETPPDELAELLKGNVDSVVSRLPELTLTQIERLGELEQAGQQRKGILGAIAERLLSEASQKEGGGL